MMIGTILLIINLMFLLIKDATLLSWWYVVLVYVFEIIFYIFLTIFTKMFFKKF